MRLCVLDQQPEENHVSDFDTTTDTHIPAQGGHTRDQAVHRSWASTPGGHEFADRLRAHVHDDGHRGHSPARRGSSETKASFKTSELIAYVIVAIAVLIAAAITDASDFGAQEAWFYASLLTIGYMISRGLAKSGSRNLYDAEANSNR